VDAPFGDQSSPRRGSANRLHVWPLIGLSLAVYILASSILGLIIELMLNNDAAAEFLRWWRTSAAADAVFVVGSIAGGVAGMMLAKTSKLGSIGLAAVLTGLTYTTAAALYNAATCAQVTGCGYALIDPFRGGAVLLTPLYGSVGLVFAAVAPAFARGHLVRLLAGETRPRPAGQA
jgi:hypothetical protein